MEPDVAGVGLTEQEARDRDPRCIVAITDYANLERVITDARQLLSSRRLPSSARTPHHGCIRGR